ncbi:MAG: hypothetical protein HRT35_23320 [Algicola sp.]|nr:hypothetical protein [Algicola sp.]
MNTPIAITHETAVDANGPPINNITPQSCDCGGNGPCNCIITSPLVYALGVLTPAFTTVDLRHAFLSAVDKLGVNNDDYHAVFSHSVTPDKNSSLKFRPYLYIAAQMTWVLSINNIDTYICIANGQLELDDFINILKGQSQSALVALLGNLGPAAPPTLFADLQLPIIMINQLIQPNQKTITKLTLKPNDGTMDIDRAFNYLAVNYDGIAEQQNTAKTPLQSIKGEVTHTIDQRTIVTVILQYQQSTDGLQSSYSCGIDVTDQYPFIENPLAIYVPQNSHTEQA